MLGICCFVTRISFAQQRDSVEIIKTDSVEILKVDTTSKIIEKVTDTKLSKELLKSVTRKSKENIINTRSEEAFLPYEGKIIREIYINHLDFEKSITDTSKNIKNWLVRAGNTLHNTTKEWVIRDHVFFRPKKPLNAYLLADNERYLRDLDFILDARILVLPLDHTSDSIDVMVITRDVFSIGGSLNPRGVNETKFRIYDVNFLGWGQRLQFNGYYDQPRIPNFGYEVYYRKSSLGGSLVNVTAGYTQLNTVAVMGRRRKKRIISGLIGRWCRPIRGWPVDLNSAAIGQRIFMRHQTRSTGYIDTA